MTDRRYQVFLSSTFEDLKDDRNAVIESLLTLNCFPIGMELFPAADIKQFTYIKKVIDSSDYYILLIGGCYGSLAEDDISYTEKEFDYAVEKGVPILVFIKDNSAITKDKTQFEHSEKLNNFITKASNGRLRQKYTTLDSLKCQVLTSFPQNIEISPRAGWIKGDAVTDNTYLEELNNLRKDAEEKDKVIDELMNKITTLRKITENLENDENELIAVKYEISNLEDDYLEEEVLNEYLEVPTYVNVSYKDIFKFIAINLFPDKMVISEDMENLINYFIQNITVDNFIDEIGEIEAYEIQMIKDSYRTSTYKDSLIKIILKMQKNNLIEYNYNEHYFVTEIGKKYLENII